MEVQKWNSSLHFTTMNTALNTKRENMQQISRRNIKLLIRLSTGVSLHIAVVLDTARYASPRNFRF